MSRDQDHGRLLQDALAAIDGLQARLDATQEAAHAPIAIVGLACRLPGGVKDGASYWQLLHDGVDAIKPTPVDRWDTDTYYDPNPATPGKMYVRNGGFIEDIDAFDADYFGIAPREAESMDPQQRLFLETAVAAFDNAGLPPHGARARGCGVFLGICNNDYAQLIARRDAADLDPYCGTGTSFSVAAGRLSYLLGLQGPSLAVDTACSSSLVAVDLAVQALRTGRCDLALAGGVNLMLRPESTVYFCQLRALAADGRCKAFAATADGYGRGEGIGAVVLKRLGDAVADGDRIRAVIRGSAVNHDGRSGGLTVPNGTAQDAVIRAALADAALPPSAIRYVEAHGTGTPLGDPIELRSLARVYGEGRACTAKLRVGSVKTNIGHLEAAAGIAGLIKLVLALERNEIPRHLHGDEPTSLVDWAALPLEIAGNIQIWPSGRRLAGISSFGFGGTNAHLIVEAAPPSMAPRWSGGVPVLPLSAQTPRALQVLARDYGALLQDETIDLAALCANAQSGRRHFTCRAALTGSRAQIQAALESLARGQAAAGLFTGRASDDGEAPWLPEDRTPESLALAYAQGAVLDWTALSGTAYPRLDLPAYPFERQRYWLSPGDGPVPADAAPKTIAAEVAPLDALLGSVPPAERRDALMARLQQEVQRVLRLPAPPDPARGFATLGMDSVMAVELRTRLSRALGCDLPTTLAFDHPNIARLTDHLLGTTAADVPRRTAATCAPLAVIGLSCRFPGGANDPDAFWALLRDGRDAVRRAPDARFGAQDWYDPSADDKSYCRDGAFLDTEIEDFDAAFFGIAPREAATMDPQQRLLLELGWEALEHAGCAPHSLRDSRTGLFVGINSNDHARLLAAEGVMPDAYLFTGNTFSVAAGRLSHVLGLQGPSLAIDTACSSSLVAVHLACQSLRAGECDLALAGGVNLMLAPDGFVLLSRMQALAHDGRCKAFDASADGYGRGEGGGLVALKRLGDAIAAGDRVLAVIRASAVNHDGPSSGLTVPNGPAQQRLLRDALAQAGLASRDIAYLEAHGTGTALGDPIEAEAAGAVFAERAADRPVLLGSVKSNIGHLEAAAGIAGLIKTVLALQHGVIPAHLHVRTPSPSIGWDRLKLRLTTEATTWPAGTRRAGVSSFGMSGTNAHVLVEEAPAAMAAESVATPDRPLQVLAVSARDNAALQALVARHAAHLAAAPYAALADLAFTANTGREHLARRVAFVAGSRDDLAAQLDRFGQDGAGHAEAVPAATTPKIAFLFTGQGSQYAGMGRGLFATEPRFRATIERCDEILRPLLGRSLIALLYETEPAGALDQTGFTQPALFALEFALADLWRAWGIAPSVVLGHSVGEIAAACVAGVMTLEEALRLIAGRARLMQALPAGGGMAAVLAGEQTVRQFLASHGGALDIAAINGPANVVVAGPVDEVAAFCARLAPEGIATQPLTVSHAFHSALMTPMLEAFREVANKIVYAPPRCRLIGNETGALVAAIDAGHWVRHVRAPVRFADAVATLAQQGCDLVVEIGPQPTLTALARQQAPAQSLTFLPSLRRGQDDWRPMLDSLATLYARGAAIDWDGFDRPYRRRRLALPTYPFQRRRHWAAVAKAARPAAGEAHPFLGETIDSPLPAIQFRTSFNPRTLPLVGDHLLHGRPWLNLVIHLELVLAALRRRGGPFALTDIVLDKPLILRDGADRAVQLVLDGDGFAVHALAGAWTKHAYGRFAAAPGVPARPPAPAPVRCREEIAAGDFYAAMERRGARLGPSCRWLTGLRRGEGLAIGRIRPAAPGEQDPRCVLPLGAVDAGFQVLGALLPDDARNDARNDAPDDHVLAGVGRFVWLAAGCDITSVEASLDHYDASLGRLTATLTWFGESGEVAGVAEQAALTRIAAAAATDAVPDTPRPRIDLDAVLAAADHEARAILAHYLAEELAFSRRCSPCEIDRAASLAAQLDSLIAVELKARVEANLRIAVPIAVLFEADSLDDLASLLLARKRSAHDPDDDELAALLGAVEALSDDEARRRLNGAGGPR